MSVQFINDGTRIIALVQKEDSYESEDQECIQPEAQTGKIKVECKIIPFTKKQ